MHMTTKALVLRGVDYKESDKILTLFTQEAGKLTASARGCRKKGSPIAAGCQLLCWSELVLFGYNGRWSVKGAAAGRVFCTALGCVGAMYFLALSTPITDLTLCLGRLHVPRLMVELMELIYRFIFVLTETAGHIRTAQASRLGYQSAGRSLHSLGLLASTVFLRAWRKADRVYAALESRGYAGSLATLPGDYRPGRGLYLLALAAAGVQLAVFWAERRLL